jgi:hypothetical protein
LHDVEVRVGEKMRAIEVGTARPGGGEEWSELRRQLVQLVEKIQHQVGRQRSYTG